MATVQDLCRELNLGRPAVIRAIESGQLPGYRIGDKDRYVVPDDAFRLVKMGYWEPQPARVEKVQPKDPPYPRPDDRESMTSS